MPPSLRGLRKSIYDEVYRTLIDALKEARKAAGLTQQELAYKLGRPQSFVAKLEGYERHLDVVDLASVQGNRHRTG